MLQMQTPSQASKAIEDENYDKSVNDEDISLADAEDALSAMVKDCWGQAKSVGIERRDRLVDCQRRRNGEYPPEKLSEIKATGGSAIYMQITSAKCRAAKAWLSDLFSPSGDKPWDLSPTPIPELPENLKQEIMMVVQQGMANGVQAETAHEFAIETKDRLMDELENIAKTRAEGMSDKIEDILVDAGWRTEFSEFLDDLVTFPYAIIKGVDYVQRKNMQWVQDEDGQFKPMMKKTIMPRVRRVSPFDFYPAPSVSKSLDGKWAIEHRKFTRKDLAEIRGASGYKAEEIAKVLNQYGSGGLKEWAYNEGEREQLEGRSKTYNYDEIDALEWTGSLQGQYLIQNGMTKEQIPDEFEEYQVSITVIGNYTIRAVVNPDPSGAPDYHWASWEALPNRFDGNSLPELLGDQQDMCNAAARALANNMGMASGPQVFVEKDRLEDGADATSMHPWKIWYTNSSESGGGQGIGFYQPQSNANELMTIYERFSKYADEITGLPSYAYGSDSGAGAAKTASGLSMLMNAASKTIKELVRTVDLRIIEPIVTKAFNIEMLAGEDDSIKGDAKIKARGSQALLHKEQMAVRNMEILGMTNNPVDQQIIGPVGRLEMLREAFKSQDIPTDNLPSEQELMQALQPPPQPEGMMPEGMPPEGMPPQGPM